MLLGVVLIVSSALFVATISSAINECDDFSRTSSGHGSSLPVVAASVPCNPSIRHESTNTESFGVVSSQEDTMVEEKTGQVAEDASPTTSDADQAGSVPESHLEYWAKYGQDAYNDALRDLLVNESNQPQEESASGKP